jgi:serine protease Do
MKTARFAIFSVILVGGVGLAIASLVAQGPSSGEQFKFEQDRPRVMMLDGRGSQIGVDVSDLSAADVKTTPGAAGGIRIDRVDEDSPAAKAGIREGDIVVEYDGERVRSSRQFSRLVQETAEGRSVKLSVLRGGSRQTMDVTPEARAFGWGIDGDRIGRDVARSLRDLEPRLRMFEPQLREIEPRLRELEPRLKELEPRLRELEPRFREFKFDAPGFDFNFDFPGMLTPRSRLGVQVDDLSPQLAEYFGVKDGGVLVSSVTAGSTAEKAGVKAGDVITSINGDRVRNYNDLREGLRDAPSGDITIGVTRDKKDTTLKGTIEQTTPRVRRPVRPV